MDNSILKFTAIKLIIIIIAFIVDGLHFTDIDHIPHRWRASRVDRDIDLSREPLATNQSGDSRDAYSGSAGANYGRFRFAHQ